jgi:hypothetical protein
VGSLLPALITLLTVSGTRSGGTGRVTGQVPDSNLGAEFPLRLGLGSSPLGDVQAVASARAVTTKSCQRSQPGWVTVASPSEEPIAVPITPQLKPRFQPFNSLPQASPSA